MVVVERHGQAQIICFCAKVTPRVKLGSLNAPSLTSPARTGPVPVLVSTMAPCQLAPGAESLRRQGVEPRRPLPFAGRSRLLCAGAHGARNLARRRSPGAVSAWKLYRSGSGSATGRHPKPSLMLQGRARLWSAHYREKFKRHFERGIEVGDSEQFVRAAALASPAPGHGG
ncbi:MAG TPA: hypothetical protein VK162_24620 [Streptosporangiaceae bacterium]|nr:hypothetical protein [Streptosporangiaceae bacterium]